MTKNPCAATGSGLYSWHVSGRGVGALFARRGGLAVGRAGELSEAMGNRLLRFFTRVLQQWSGERAAIQVDGLAQLPGVLIARGGADAVDSRLAIPAEGLQQRGDLFFACGRRQPPRK